MRKVMKSLRCGRLFQSDFLSHNLKRAGCRDEFQKKNENFASLQGKPYLCYAFLHIGVFQEINNWCLLVQSGEICMIGSGNVATHLAHALEGAGYVVASVFSRRLEHAQLLASSLSRAMATNDPDALPVAQTYVFCVKDDAIDKLAKRLAKRKPGRECLVLHTAGSVPLSTISGLFENTAVLYPMQTFSRTRNVDFSKVPLFVEGSNEHSLQLVTQMAAKLSDTVTPLDSRRRLTLHLASVFACNFTNHCYALADEILQEAGIDPKFLLPLIDETAKKVHDLSPIDAQTGPAARWDETVMERQMQLLGDNQEATAIYKSMSLSIHSLHKRHQSSSTPLYNNDKL